MKPAPASGAAAGHDPRPLLLAAGLNQEEVAALLSPYGFADLKQADANLQSIAGDPRARQLLANILGDLLDGVAGTANPDQALTSWERVVSAGLKRTQLFDYLHGAPRMLHVLCAIFGNTPALTQTLVRDPLLVYWLVDEEVLTRSPTRRELETTLHRMLDSVSATELKLEALRRFRRREMLRIGVRDLLRFATVRETTRVLSELAGVLISAAFTTIQAELQHRFGRPTHRPGRGRPVETRFVVLAMGKLGGGELNYSSDVDLLYVYETDEGQTRPVPRHAARTIISIPNEEYFEYLARDLTRALTEITQEGYVFRVDLRLRAEGAVGRLARTLGDYEQYYRARGKVWERLALLKAWPVAGSVAVGRTFLRRMRPFVLGPRGAAVSDREAAAVLDEVRGVKELIDQKMANRGHQLRNVKLGTGGIREVEFMVQAIQVLLGRRLPQLLDRNTLGALGRFHRLGLLSKDDYEALTQAYMFLRDVEHKLQMEHDLQTHALPDSPGELARCAVRLGWAGADRKEAATWFQAEHQRHTGRVRKAFRELFYEPDRSSLLHKGLAKARARP